MLQASDGRLPHWPDTVHACIEKTAGIATYDDQDLELCCPCPKCAASQVAVLLLESMTHPFLQVDYVLNKTKEDMFSSPVLAGVYEDGQVKGDFALPSSYKGEAPKGWEKPEPVSA